MKLHLFGRENLEVEASILFKADTHLLLKVTDKEKFEENIDAFQYASSFKFDTQVGEILDRQITPKHDFYIVRIEFE
jgi:hypothetical protein